MTNTRHARLLLLVIASLVVLALLLVRLRSDPAAGSAVSVDVPLPPAPYVADLVLLELQQVAVSAPPSPSPLPAPALPAKATIAARSPRIAVVTAEVQPTTVRKVIVSKGRRVVRNVPVTLPEPAAGDAAPVPRTARFDMNQNGKQMTADEFDVWMKAQGIRVATGVATPTPPPPPPPPAQPICGPGMAC